jgi:hypothetical protein
MISTPLDVGEALGEFARIKHGAIGNVHPEQPNEQISTIH